MKTDIGRSLKFKNIKSIKLHSILKGKQWRLIGTDNKGYSHHLVEIEVQK